MRHFKPHLEHPQTKPLPKNEGASANSVLGWPAWLRVLAVLPAVLLLWLAVWWANTDTGIGPW